MIKNKRIGMLTILIFVITVSSACNNKALEDMDFSKTAVVKVDSSPIFLNELMYHVTLAELQGQLYASFLKDTDFWNKEYSKGVTMGDVMKQEAMDNAIKYELLYHRAVDESYSLTEEEIASCARKVESILKTLTKEDTERMDLTEEELLVLQKKIALSTRYYQDYFSSNNIDDETAYKEMTKGHKIKVNKKVWKQVRFGKIKK